MFFQTMPMEIAQALTTKRYPEIKTKLTLWEFVQSEGADLRGNYMFIYIRSKICE